MSDLSRIPKLFPYKDQPFKGLYLAYALATMLTIKLPIWVILSAIPSFRQGPAKNWGFLKSLMFRALRWLVNTNNQVGQAIKFPDHNKLSPNPRKNVRGVWIKPLEENRIPSEILAHAGLSRVKPVRIPGYWYHRSGDPILGGELARPNEKVVIYLHGGGYIYESAHPDDFTMAESPNVMLKSGPHFSRVLCVEYRLASCPPFSTTYENPFPAQLLDALSAYKYVIETLKFKPENVTVAGDSAGANLSIQLVRSLISYPELGWSNSIPENLVLFSPWTDIGGSHEGPGTSLQRNQHVDFVGSYIGYGYAVKAYTAPFNNDFASTNVYISPASKRLPSNVLQGQFKGFPRTFITAGGLEQLLDQIRTFHSRMVEELGLEKVTYIEVDEAFHDPQLFVWAQPERNVIIAELRRWLTATG